MENLCTLKENSITQTILDENLKIKLQNKQLDLGKCERWKANAKCSSTKQ